MATLEELEVDLDKAAAEQARAEALATAYSLHYEAARIAADKAGDNTRKLKQAWAAAHFALTGL